MSDQFPTPEQVKRLVDACTVLSAYFAADACRVIVEWPEDANIIPYLENLPVKVVREFDEALRPIAWPEDFSDSDQRAKYEAAMAEMRSSLTERGGV